MSLLYKPDWDKVNLRYMAWWAREETGVPVLVPAVSKSIAGRQGDTRAGGNP